MVARCTSIDQGPFIAVNQIGYYPNDSKQAFLVNGSTEEFLVTDVNQNRVVYRGQPLQTLPPDPATGDSIAILDFSDVTREGEYYIQLADGDQVRSHRVFIKNDVYRDALITVLRSYYLNRCGIEINNETEWDRQICHLQDAEAPFYNFSDLHSDVTGGWHDAGDYNKFSINKAYTVGLLLGLYELSPGYFADGMLKIPESGNGIPDILDEVRWALEWLRKMQRHDGGIYHKVSQKTWVGEFLPHEDTETRYIFQVSSNSTASFTAVAAMAARLFEGYDNDFSSRMFNAAMAGWDYLENYPITQPLGGFKNPPDVRGGEYGDPNDRDERLWAAVEMYRLTGEDKFLNYFIRSYRNINISRLPPISWTDLHMLALSSFLTLSLSGDHSHHQLNIISDLEDFAENKLWKTRTNNYRTLLERTEYYWGSSSVNLGYAYTFIQLYRYTGKEKYLQTAYNQLHYTLGKNPFNQTFVTGLGTRPVQNPYFQFSMVKEHKNPVPGMMVGGPNNVVHLGKRAISRWPGKNYEDRANNYYVNEVAINYTAIFAYVTGFFAIQNGSDHEIFTDKINPAEDKHPR
jgi:endoglucanase